MKKAIIFLLLVALVSCNNDDDSSSPLPPATQMGANTFGCYIDGKLFMPRDGTGTFNSPDRAVYFITGYPELTSYYEFDIHDYKSERTANLLMHIQALDANGIGDYIIDESNGSRGIDGLDHTYMHCRVWKDGVGYQYYLSYENSGMITITSYNLDMRLVSGIFNGRVRNYQQPYDTIQITQGRFDFKWDTLDETVFP